MPFGIAGAGHHPAPTSLDRVPGHSLMRAFDARPVPQNDSAGTFFLLVQ